MPRLAHRLRDLLWESYRKGGRWTHRVYQRGGQACPSCGERVRMIRQGKTKRTASFCPACRRE